MENRKPDLRKKKTYNKPLEFIHPDDRFLPASFVSAHLSRYYLASQYATGKKVLDMACGSGYGSAYLKYKGASRVVGADISPEAISYANDYYSSLGIDFVVMDAQRPSFEDNSFDVIVSMETIEHLADVAAYLEGCVRIIKQDGFL